MAWTPIQPEGELDISSVAQLREMLTGALTGGATHLLIDLSGVSFIDSSALGVFVSAYRKAVEAGGEMAFAGVNPQVRRVFELTRTERFFRFFPTAADAPAL